LNHGLVAVACRHEAAHVVAAITVGCPVEYSDLEGGIGWCLEGAGLDDLQTVCAAGYAMERLLGRSEEQAWNATRADRTLMTVLSADLTGTQMPESVAKDRFLQAAAECEAILRHPSTARAVEALAEKLEVRYRAGDERMPGREVMEIVNPFLGVPVCA
jgi:hypothetical protein